MPGGSWENRNAVTHLHHGKPDALWELDVCFECWSNKNATSLVNNKSNDNCINDNNNPSTTEQQQTKKIINGNP
jgi:hypothetical protein